jgi:hypothetical protein
MFGEIEVEQSSFFTTHHTFRTPSGTVGELTLPAFSDYGTYRTPDGNEVRLAKTHWLSGTYELVEGERVRGRAERQGFLSRDLDVWFDGQALTLERRGWFDQGWYLVDAGGQILLEISPRGFFRQGATISLACPVEATLMIFVYYLAYVRHQEEAAAAAAS